VGIFLYGIGGEFWTKGHHRGTKKGPAATLCLQEKKVPGEALKIRTMLLEL